MAGVRYPIEMVNGVPVVAAPEEIDASNADCLRAVLLEAAARGHETFVVDPDPHEAVTPAPAAPRPRRRAKPGMRTRPGRPPADPGASTNPGLTVTTSGARLVPRPIPHRLVSSRAQGAAQNRATLLFTPATGS